MWPKSILAEKTFLAAFTDGTGWNFQILIALLCTSLHCSTLYHARAVSFVKKVSTLAPENGHRIKGDRDQSWLRIILISQFRPGSGVASYIFLEIAMGIAQRKYADEACTSIEHDSHCILFRLQWNFVFIEVLVDSSTQYSLSPAQSWPWARLTLDKWLQMTRLITMTRVILMVAWLRRVKVVMMMGREGPAGLRPHHWSLPSSRGCHQAF